MLFEVGFHLISLCWSRLFCHSTVYCFWCYELLLY